MKNSRKTTTKTVHTDVGNLSVLTIDKLEHPTKPDLFRFTIKLPNKRILKGSGFIYDCVDSAVNAASQYSNKKLDGIL